MLCISICNHICFCIFISVFWGLKKSGVGRTINDWLFSAKLRWNQCRRNATNVISCFSSSIIVITIIVMIIVLVINIFMIIVNIIIILTKNENKITAMLILCSRQLIWWDHNKISFDLGDNSDHNYHCIHTAEYWPKRRQTMLASSIMFVTN